MKSILLTTLILFFSTSVYAEFLGLTPGRSARVQAHAKTSIEIGAGWYSDQLSWTALRLNTKPSQGLTLFIDYAKLRVTNLPINASSQASFFGYGFGGGVVFGVPDFLPSFDIAFKGAYHVSKTTNKSVTQGQSAIDVTLHQQQWNAGLLVSPIDPIFEDGLSWYGTVGYVSTGAHAKFNNKLLTEAGPVSYRDKSGWAMGAGLVKPIDFGVAYAGIEWLSNDPLLAAGFRYSF